MPERSTRGLRASLWVVLAVASSASAADRPEAAWSTVVGVAGCERVLPEVPGFALTIPVGSLPSCGVQVADPSPLAGHRIALTASFDAAGRDVPTVSLMLTQFRGGRILWHQFVSSRIDAGQVVPLALRTYALADGDAMTVSVQAVNATTPIVVRDLALTALSAVVEGAMSADARTYLDHALDAIGSHAIALEPARRASLMRESRALASGAARPDETYDAIRYALARLGDGHSQFFDPAAAAARVSATSTSKPPYGLERVALDASVAYLAIPAFEAFDAAGRAAYARFVDFWLRGALAAATTDGLVIDLRSQSGGSFVLDGLCPLFAPRAMLFGFADRRAIVERRSCKDDPTVDDARLRTIPVAVLVGPTTASAGEMLAIALKGRERTVLIGSSTRGLTTGNEIVRLRDGALLALATTISVDRAGQRYTRGVDPGIVVAPQAAATHDRSDPAIVRAREWIAASIRARGSPQ